MAGARPARRDRHAGDQRPPTACWCARAGSSPTTSRCSTTSTSRPAGAPRTPGWRSGARRSSTTTTPSWPPSPNASWQPLGREPDRRRRRWHRRARQSPNVSPRSAAATPSSCARATDRLGGKLRTSPFAGRPAVDEGADAFLARVPHGTALAHRVGLGLSAHDTGRHERSDLARRPAAHPRRAAARCAGRRRSARPQPVAEHRWQAARRHRAAAAPYQGSRRLDRHAHPRPLRRRGARAPRRRPRRQHLRRRHRPLQPGDGAATRGARRRSPQPAAGGATHPSPRPARRRTAVLRPAAGHGGARHSDRGRRRSGRRRRRALGAGDRRSRRTGARWRVDDESADVVVLATPAPSAPTLLPHPCRSSPRCSPPSAYAGVVIVTLAVPALPARRASGSAGTSCPSPTSASSRPSRSARRSGSTGATATRSCACRSAATDCPSTTSTTTRSSRGRRRPRPPPRQRRAADVGTRAADGRTPSRSTVPGTCAGSAAVADATPSGLFLTGAGYRGIGVPACIADAERTATDVLGHLAR